MWPTHSQRPWSPMCLFAVLAVWLLPSAAAEKVLRSTSLNSCQENSEFTASLFDFTFTPSNNSALIDLIAVSTISGKVHFDITVTAYGYQIIHTTVNPCDPSVQDSLGGLCPMNAGKTDTPFSIPVPASASSQIPGIAYTFPDLDARVQIIIKMVDTGENVACIQAEISNGMTVDLASVKWVSAGVIMLAMVASAFIYFLGHLNAASHVAVNTLCLLSYYQSQAMLGMCSVPMPPIVQSWTQDLQWSMGVIKVGWMQNIFTWYQRSTGGTASDIFDSLSDISVDVQKRSLLTDERLFRRTVGYMGLERASAPLHKRANIATSTGSYIVYGIQRVAFKAGIETTNMFLTCLTWFMILSVFTMILVGLVKLGMEVAVKTGRLRRNEPSPLNDFRVGWATILKGILYRACFIGYPIILVLGFWEFTQDDSAALIVLAVAWILNMIATMAWASWKIYRLAAISIRQDNTPAKKLFEDPNSLNKWGFLYIPFRANAYYFLFAQLGYLLLKALFVGFAQKSGEAQAVAFIIIEAAALIATSVVRPWMDKTTNSYNIAICVVNFLNAWFLLIFSNVFDQPGLVTGVISIVLWIMNAALTLILLLMIIISTTIIFFKENPDARYNQMADDRTSFMKSSNSLVAGGSSFRNNRSQLDALGTVAARTLDDESDVEDEAGMSREKNPNNRRGAQGSIRTSTPVSMHNSNRFSMQRGSLRSLQANGLSAPLMTTAASPISPGGVARGSYDAPHRPGTGHGGGATLSREPSREPSPLSAAGSAHSAGQVSNTSGRAGSSGLASDGTSTTNAGLLGSGSAHSTGAGAQRPWQRGAGYE